MTSLKVNVEIFHNISFKIFVYMFARNFFLYSTDFEFDSDAEDG